MIKIQKFNENGMGNVVSAQPSPIPGKQVPDNQPVIIPCGVTYENIITNFEKYFKILEDGAVSCDGMGAVVSAQPSATPGDVAGGTQGSGDIGHVFGTSTKTSSNLKRRKKRIRKVTELSQEIFESFDDFVTFEMTGSPKDTRRWRYKEDFERDMYSHGFRHTTLTKKTDILIAEDEHFGSIKWNKAKSFGIPIMTFTEAWEKREQIFIKKFGKEKLDQLISQNQFDL